jgi:hypothetical protein
MMEVSEVRIDDVVVANRVQVQEGSAVVYTSPFGNSVSFNIRNGAVAGMEVVTPNGRRIPGRRVPSRIAQTLAADKVAQRLATKQEKWDKQATWVCASVLEFAPSTACYQLDIDPRRPLPLTGAGGVIRRGPF